MKIKFHCDDFGLTKGFTKATYDCYKNGVANSVSIRVNGTDFRYALFLAKNKMPKARIGLHFNITEGPATTEVLADKNGHYCFGFLGLLLYSYINRKKSSKLIKKELEAQYELLIKNGLRPVFIDSQDHAHMIPSIFKTVCEFAQKHKIKEIRLSNEPFHLINNPKYFLYPFISLNILKFIILKYFSLINKKILNQYKISTPQAFYGVIYTNMMDKKVLESSIKHAQKAGYHYIETLSHPAYPRQNEDIVYTSPFIAKYANLKNRKIEAKALLNLNRKTYLSSR